MAEAHQPVAPGQRLLQPGLRLGRLADGVQHLDHRAWRAAVQRPLQGADPRQHGRAESGVRRRHDPRSEGRGVQPVVADGDQIGIECRRFRVRRRPAAGHPQDVRGVAERRVGRHRRLAALRPQDGGREHRRRGKQTQGRRQVLAIGQPGDQSAHGLYRTAVEQAGVQGGDLGEHLHPRPAEGGC
jgi:hypothetical protein